MSGDPLKYPPPSYAANIWIARGLIHLGMDGHTIRVDPANPEWPRVLLEVLRERDRLGRPAKIAEKASITQHQLERALKVTVVGPKKRSIDLDDLYQED